MRKEFAGIEPTGPEFYDTLQRLWLEFSLPTFNRTLSSAANQYVAAGLLLPTELLAMIDMRATQAAQLTFAKQKDEGDAAEMLAWLAGWDGVHSGNHLPTLIAGAANQLPPTDKDLVVYYAVSRGIEEMDASTSSSNLESWVPLAHAKNPVYRLLALQAAVRTTSAPAQSTSSEDPRFSSIDAPTKVSFFRAFLTERDPLIVTTALNAMAATGSLEAKSALVQFRALHASNPDFVNAADEALHSCELMLKTMEGKR